MSNRYSFYFASLILCLVYGMAAEKYQWFPSPLLHYMLDQARLAVGEVRDDDQWYYLPAGDRTLVSDYQPQQVQPGLTLVTGIGEDRTLQIKVIDFDGSVIYHWDIDWYQLWPDATHIPEHLIPRGKPGTHIHGSKLMANGDIVFNFENLGLVRLNSCGVPVFKLAYPTHHSVEVDDDGNFWLPGQVYQQTTKMLMAA